MENIYDAVAGQSALGAAVERFYERVTADSRQYAGNRHPRERTELSRFGR